MAFTENDISELYQSHSKKLIQFLMANGSDYAIACDLMQDAFVKLWAKRDDIADAQAASGFLFAVVKNLKIDYIRKNKRLVFDDEMAGDLGETTEHPQQDSSDMAQLRNSLQAAFAQLPDSLRETYTLFQVSQYSIKEIAVITDASESLVKVRIHRAKEKLQDILSQMEDLSDYL